MSVQAAWKNISRRWMCSAFGRAPGNYLGAPEGGRRGGVDERSALY
jgi:hypothetical protein